MTVSSIVGEPLLEHGKSSSRERQERVEELLGLVGLDPTHAYFFDTVSLQMPDSALAATGPCRTGQCR
jgi:ABC-type glutathione transport system ATPase component